MERTEAEKAANYILNELLSFADKPEDAKEKRHCETMEPTKLKEQA